MGYIRGIQPASLDRSQVRAVVSHFICETDIAEVFAEQDPFQIGGECTGHPAGHYPIRSAGDVVCANWPCGKVLLR